MEVGEGNLRVSEGPCGLPGVRANRCHSGWDHTERVEVWAAAASGHADVQGVGRRTLR